MNVTFKRQEVVKRKTKHGFNFEAKYIMLRYDEKLLAIQTLVTWNVTYNSLFGMKSFSLFLHNNGMRVMRNHRFSCQDVIRTFFSIKMFGLGMFVSTIL